MQDKKYAILASMLRKRSKLYCLKSFVPITRAGVFIWEKFHPGYRDLGNRASPASHMNTTRLLRRKEWRGEIWQTDRASPVYRAYMKRPLVCYVECRF